jgi:hypothetical protein
LAATTLPCLGEVLRAAVVERGPRALQDVDARPVVRLLMDQIGGYYERTEGRIADLEESLEERLAAHEDRIKRHFDLTVETIRHDLLGAHKDDLESIKDRLIRLERHTGLATC